MSRFGRIHRRPDHFRSPHDRARARAAERMDGPLGLAEATWLDDHLAGCAACAAIAAGYETDRAALRALRGAEPVPPRDLWARTAAAIEQESAARGRSGPRVTGAARDRRRVPVGLLSGLAVVVVVVGVTAVSGDLFGTGGPSTAAIASDAADVTADTMAGGAAPSDAAIAAALPTPIAVGAGNVKWVRLDGDGQLALNDAAVDEVCPPDGEADCGTLDDAAAKGLAFAARPRSIIASPVDDQAIMVSGDGDGNDQVFLMSLPSDGAGTTAPDPEPTPSPTTESTRTASPTPPPSDAPASPSTDPGAESSPTAATPSADPAETSATPSAAIPSDAPAATPSPEPTVAANLAIASGVEVVGESAAFSADGHWFAFTARPSDGAGGPDVYVWKVGDQEARRLTEDGASTFASWAGDAVVASRPVPSDTASEALVSATVTIDPTTGDESAATTAWRPAVDPTGTRAVAWAGTIVPGPDSAGWRPDEGRLELRSWPDDGREAAVQVVADGPLGDFDVRWDETGAWFAVWVADATDPAIGRLSLFEVDPGTGLLDQPDGGPDGTPALAGFSIGQGRLAWATPPGQGGEGSRVQIVAWTDDAVGSIETAPGTEIVVIR